MKIEPMKIDAYRVRVWPGRTGEKHKGRRGWVVEVDYLSDWALAGDQPMIEPAMWFPTREEATDWGIAEATDIHDTDCNTESEEFRDLLIYVGEIAYVNGKPVAS